MASMPFTDHNSGPKKIARRVSMSGKYSSDGISKTTWGPAKHVLNLPGFSTTNVSGQKRVISCEDVIQGIDEGIIAPDAKIWGIENRSELIPHIREFGNSANLDLTVVHDDLRQFAPPQKLDKFIGDLMCLPQTWIGSYLRNVIVPKMKKRYSSMAVNICVQSAHSAPSMGVFRDMYDADPSAYLCRSGWDLERPQDPIWAEMDVIDKDIPHTELARSINPHHGINRGEITRNVEDEACFLTFVGIHHHLRDTDFIYRGCYLYRQTSKSMKMLTLYYSRS